MNLLLDTHALLWMADGAPQLSARAAAEIANTSNVKAVSVASLWEIAIKVSTRKLTLARPLAEFMAELRATGLLQFMPVLDAHLVTVATLPFHHRDPFDRLLIAQALTDGFTIVGTDPAFDAYGVARLW